jgi:CheY-like chemotaxis protein
MIRSFIRDQEVLVTRIRVLLADDHEDFLRKLRGELDPEFEIVGTAENGEDAVDAVCRLDPDVLVTDMAMPVMDGLQATERLRGANCRTKIVFLTIQHIMIADDHAFLADACKKLLEPEFDVVATVGDGRALVRIAATLKPKVIVLDVGMPLLNGLDAGQQSNKCCRR